MPGVPTSKYPHIAEAFQEQPALAKRVFSALGDTPKHAQLFSDIGTFICELKRRLPPSPEPANKKRKLEENGQSGSAANGSSNKKGTSAALWPSISTPPVYKLPDVSFTIPQRKKLHMEIIKDGPRGADGGIRAVSAANGTVEFGVAWRDVEQVFCVPIPEKAKRQHNFVVIPRHGDGVTAPPEGVTAPEPIVWTFVEAAGKEIKEGVDPGPGPTVAAINEHLSVYGKKVIVPDKKQFASAIPEPHRKGETAYHVKAFRGSKEGYLFFTSVGILFGFKKPLTFFSFENISSISYTSVLQRTFNLVITVAAASPGDKDQEIEFSMLDQQDYTGIDEYIKAHGLNDASMAAARKAKKLNINGPPQAENGEGEDDDDDGETELQKAERMLDDEEDEDEEDYEPPPSDAETDGSGTDSDEDSEDEDEDEEEDEEEDEDGADGRNLVADELGSEAEDVEMSEKE